MDFPSPDGTGRIMSHQPRPCPRRIHHLKKSLPPAGNGGIIGLLVSLLRLDGLLLLLLMLTVSITDLLHVPMSGIADPEQFG